MPIIAVYHDDVRRYFCDLDPDRWMCCWYEITDAEYAELGRLLTEQAKLQNLLRRISERPERED